MSHIIILYPEMCSTEGSNSISVISFHGHINESDLFSYLAYFVIVHFAKGNDISY